MSFTLDVVCGLIPTSASCVGSFPSILSLHTHSSFVTGFVSKLFYSCSFGSKQEKKNEREREKYGSL